VSGRVSGEALLLHPDRKALMVRCVDLSGRWSGEGMVDRQLVHGQHAQRNNDGANEQQQSRHRLAEAMPNMPTG